tara:strand:- start:1106 stop:1450 length:345 start_codon:yes stop_codon:yes gene_type:complete
MKIIKTTERQINLCSDLDRSIDKTCMKIKVEYNEYDEDADVGIIPAITSLFLDDELDPFELDFVEDAIEINTKDYTHISLSENHLLFLLQFYRYAKKIDDKCFNMTKSQAKLFK